MTIVVLLGAIALLFGCLIIFIKIIILLASYAEAMIKMLFMVAIVMMVGVCVAYYKPEMYPHITTMCHTTSDFIKELIKPFIS
jgi:vacuolar-type H+-ATPase subunit I/STV1